MFSILNLQINRGLTSANAQGKDTAVIHTYIDLNSTIATIRLYLPPNLNQGATQRLILVNDYMLVGGSDTTIFSQVLSLDPFTLGIDLFSGASGLSIGPPIAALDNNGAIITGQILQLENADSTHNGIVTAVAQEFGGKKTFREEVIIIPDNDFIVAPPPVEGLLIKTQDVLSGIQIQTDTSTNIMAYSFGTVGLGANYAGLVFSETAFGIPFAPGLFLALGSVPAIGIDNAGNTSVTLILHVNTIAELSLGNGTTINGNNIKSNQIVLNNSDIFWDTDIIPATTRFSFDANDYFIYDKTGNALNLLIGSIIVAEIDGADGIQTDLGFDRITPGQLNIALNNATSIFLAKPVSMFGGGTLLVDNIDTATPATPLTLGAINASAINLDENTVVANTKTLQTNTLDSTTAGALTLGGTTATSIVLDEDSTVSAGKLFKANSVDAATATALVIGDTTATAITLDKNTTVTAGQLFKANSVDAATAVPIVIGDTTATAITLDKNTTVTTGSTLTADSITLLTTGGTPAPLDFYAEDYSFTTTFTLNALTTAAIPINLVRIGKNITVHSETQGSTGSQAITGIAFQADTVLPAAFRPGFAVFGFIKVSNGGVVKEGVVQIDSAGVIKIVNDVNGTTAYTTLTTNLFFQFTVSYNK